MTILLKYLSGYRCLLILDNAESILETAKSQKDSYSCQSHPDYGQLFKLIGATKHQSCLLLTSREKPQEISSLEREYLQVRCLQLETLQYITLWDVATGQFLKIIRPQRLYEEMNITGVTGLTSAQQETLKILGAVNSF
ncbi:hypothetical protein [Pleurocapsa sp. PCC 7319]|uniref:hypothetical protein n=1 Tax=Pleurocapsa sp. PCC 7319 TaxID=118161 RepID=UPI00034B2E00|nr:hypothetical protein [Pleurocapsa sp. PCC 7319]